MSADVLPPGGEGQISVTLTPKGSHEDILKHITVVSDDPEQPRFSLTMKGKLLVDVSVEPGTVNFGQLGLGEAGVATFHLRVREDSGAAVEITAVELEEAEGFTLRTLEPSADGRLAYELRFAGSPELGAFATRVKVRSSGPNTPELTIPVRARVVGNLGYPVRLLLRERDGVFGTRQLRITARDRSTPTITKIEDRDGLLTITPRTPQPGSLILDVEVDSAAWAALDPSRREGPHPLILHTTEPGQRRIEIPYTLAPASGSRLPTPAARDAGD